MHGKSREGLQSKTEQGRGLGSLEKVTLLGR